jgi:hypothetical protein
MMVRYERPLRVDFVPGDATGLSIPADGDALRIAGEPFLTEAFRRFGALSEGNRVARITRLEPFSGGNSGQKVLLSVEYAYPSPGLHADLFVKFSRDFHDAFRDRRRHELEAECRLAALSRLPHFPIDVPAAYFADFHGQSGTGLLITQRIALGSGNIEPLRPKCRDYELADPLAYYRPIMTTLARLAAAHKSGALSPHVERYFPFDPELAAADDPIPYSESQLRAAIARYADFVADHPQLMPAHLASADFIARLERDAVRFLRHEAVVQRFLQAQPEFIALCHYNANIDNAWFWRDPSGQRHCGLLDWGRVRQMNVAYALWGSLCCAELTLWDEHLDELLDLFVGELQRGGGPQLELAQLRMHLHFYVATMGLGTLIEAPTLVLSRLPEAATAHSARDPVFRKDNVVSGFLHVFTTCLNLWHRHDFGASLDRLLQSGSA